MEHGQQCLLEQAFEFHFENSDPLTPPEVVCATSFAKLEAAERYLQGERTREHLPLESDRTPKRTFNIRVA